ncbi:MAG: PAS domain S-box protein, partial [Gammaproteobacteria bacterium]|nr:PAS domain S-box protein [Gammaproteobacteria bacterium]
MRSRSITRRLIFSIVLFSSFITLFLTSLQLYNDYQADLDNVDMTFRDVELGLLGAIASNVWLDDKDELKITLKGVNALPEINYIAIYVNDKEYVSSGKKNEHDVVSKSIPVTHSYNKQNIEIGKLYIEADLESIYQRLINRFWLILLSNAFKTFLVAIFMFTLVERVIINKLKRIYEFVDSNEVKNFEDRIGYLDGKPESSYDEIDKIASALNRKQGSLENYFIRLEESEMYTRLLLNSTGEGIYGIDVDGNCTFVNSVCVQLLGYDSEEELLEKNMHELIHYSHPDGRSYPVSECPIYNVNKAGETYHCNTEVFWRSDGSSFPVEYITNPIEQQGSILGSVVTFRDISERKRIEALVHSAQQRMALHFQSTPLGVIEWDTKFCVTEWNPAAQTIFGYTREEALGRHARELIIPESLLGQVDEIWNELLSSSISPRSPGENITKDGHSILCEWYNTPLIDEVGAVIGVASLVQDVTEKKMAENALVIAKEQAESANQAKTEFLSSMSHELRTPMNAILGFGQLLNYDNALGDEQKSFVDEILKGGNHLMELINEILDLSKIESGKLECYPEKIQLDKILAQCLSFIAPLAMERKVKLIDNISPSIGLAIQADPGRCKQVLLNLLSNAIKYNQVGGSVSLSFNVVDGRQLRVTVSDTGPGLSQQQQKLLFRPFERIVEYRGIDGTGIGLVITKRLVELMGG